MKIRFVDILLPRFKEICIERDLNFYNVLYEWDLHEDLENIYQFEITDEEYNALLEAYSIEKIVDTYIEHFEDNEFRHDLATMCLNKNEWDREK